MHSNRRLGRDAIAFVIITLTISLSLVNIEATHLQNRFTSTIDT